MMKKILIHWPWICGSFVAGMVFASIVFTEIQRDCSNRPTLPGCKEKK